MTLFPETFGAFVWSMKLIAPKSAVVKPVLRMMFIGPIVLFHDPALGFERTAMPHLEQSSMVFLQYRDVAGGAHDNTARTGQDGT